MYVFILSSPLVSVLYAYSNLFSFTFKDSILLLLPFGIFDVIDYLLVL